MNQAVYVGNIPWTTTQEELLDYMSQCGHVESVVIPLYRDRPKGFGIVTYTTPEAATRAISELDGSVINDRTINVRENQPHQPSPTIFVGNLAWEVTWQELKDHFRQVGEIVHADVLKDYNGVSKGCGVVEFQSSKQAQDAIVMFNQSELKGRSISVREHRQNKPRFQNKPRNFYQRHNSRQKTQRSDFYEQPRRNYSYKNSDRQYSYTRRDTEHVEPVEQVDTSCRVYVSNLPYRLQWQELKDYMRSAGYVTNVNIFKNQFDGRSKGCGIVEFQTPEAAQTAISTLHNCEFQGRSISVQADRGRQKPIRRN